VAPAWVDTADPVVPKPTSLKKKEAPVVKKKNESRLHVNPNELIRFYEDLGDGTLFIGIDPGTTGAIALLPAVRTLDPILIDIPTNVFTVSGQFSSKKKSKTGKKTRTVPDYLAILAIFDPLINAGKMAQCAVCLEHTGPQPQDSPFTGFSMGSSYGMWPLFLAAFGFPVEEVIPSTWKRLLKMPEGLDKEGDRVFARKLFPQAAKWLCCKSDHNRADAILLAEACRRRHQSKEQS
jgi:hypothetical protein